MSKHTLTLVRHCKAAHYSTGSDLERPLTEAGLAQAVELGRQMKDVLTALDVALVSPAVRAQQTWEGMARGAGLTEGNMPQVKTEEQIYSGSSTAILETVRMGATGYNAIVVGHEPTISSAVSLVVEIGGDNGIGSGMSTGSAAVVEADKDWHEWHSHVAKVVNFVRVPHS